MSVHTQDSANTQSRRITTFRTSKPQAGLRWRMSGQHPAQRVPRLSEAAERTLAEFEAWFPSQLAGPIELALIGDFDREEALDAVARTFGALPERLPDNLATARQGAAAPTVPFSDTISFHGMPGVAVVAFAWPATPGSAGPRAGSSGSPPSSPCRATSSPRLLSASPTGTAFPI